MPKLQFEYQKLNICKDFKHLYVPRNKEKLKMIKVIKRRTYWLRWGWIGGRPGSSEAGPLRSSSLVLRTSPNRAADSPDRRSARRCCRARSPRSSDASSRSYRGRGPTLGDGKQQRSEQTNKQTFMRQK